MLLVEDMSERNNNLRMQQFHSACTVLGKISSHSFFQVFFCDTLPICKSLQLDFFEWVFSILQCGVKICHLSFDANLKNDASQELEFRPHNSSNMNFRPTDLEQTQDTFESLK